MYDYISTPGVVVELDQVEKNLKTMVERNSRYNIQVRPHIKPHKSVYFAELQCKFGAKGITCAKLTEAEVMADHGITDILIAFPLIGIDKMERLGKLIKRASVMTIVNSIEGAQQLSKVGESHVCKLNVLIEVDGGLKRGGLSPYLPTLAFARQIRNLKGINIVGLMYYGGLIYAEKTRDGYDSETKREHDEIIGTAELLKKDGFQMDILSGGNSYSAKCCNYLEGITEVRCGNYIFNDVSTLATGFATEDACALRAVATIIAKVDAFHAIIDAGSKTLTTDLTSHRPGYGYVVNRPDIKIVKLNEEHGFIESEQPINLNIGDKIAIIPNHACVLPNLTNEVYGIRDGKIERLIPIEARGSRL